MNELSMILLFGLYALATWRIGSLIIDEAGPFNILLRFRALMRNHAPAGLAGLITCIWCASPWIAGVIIIGHGVALGWSWDLLLWPFAISAVAVMIHEKFFVENA